MFARNAPFARLALSAASLADPQLRGAARHERLEVLAVFAQLVEELLAFVLRALSGR
jgi:hypothetical protein